MNWHNILDKDLTRLPEMVSYYEKELEMASPELSLKGGKTLEKHAAELPGILEVRFRQLQEIEAVLEYLNKKVDKLKSEHFRRYIDKHNRSLSSRDIEKYIDGEDDVFNLYLLINEVALLRNKFIAIHKGIEAKNFMIGHITKLRCAGLDTVNL